jgi:hypothetical protein
MEELFTRFFENTVNRFTGPMHFRIYLQPTIASCLAIISGIRDAKRGWSPYFRTLLKDPEHRPEMIRDGWQSVGKVFVLAMVLDIIYQFFFQQRVYPLGVVLAGVVLAIIPYVIVRGLVGRTVSLFMGREKPKSYAKDTSK